MSPVTPIEIAPFSVWEANVNVRVFPESTGVPGAVIPVMVPAAGVPDVPGGTVRVTEVSAWLVVENVKV